MNVEISSTAEADLEEITDYIARDNSDRALTFVDEILEACAALARFPDMGRPVPEMTGNEGVTSFREIIHHRYRIVYTTTRNCIIVLTVRHAARLLKLPPPDMS